MALPPNTTNGLSLTVRIPPNLRLDDNALARYIESETTGISCDYQRGVWSSRLRLSLYLWEFLYINGTIVTARFSPEFGKYVLAVRSSNFRDREKNSNFHAGSLMHRFPMIRSIRRVDWSRDKNVFAGHLSLLSQACLSLSRRTSFVLVPLGDMGICLTSSPVGFSDGKAGCMRKSCE